MKSFRRRCGEGITTPLRMRGAGMEGEGRQVGWRRGEEEKGKGGNEARTRSQQERERPRAAAKQEAQKPNERRAGHSGRERRLEARWHTGCNRAGWWLFPENLSASLCVRESPLLPQIISHHLRSSTLRFSGVSGPSSPAWQAEHGNCQEAEGWNVKPLWCFKHDAAAQVCARLTSGSY